MTTTEALRRQDNYALGRTPEEYDRLRAQARAWESALEPQAGPAEYALTS